MDCMFYKASHSTHTASTQFCLDALRRTRTTILGVTRKSLGLATTDLSDTAVAKKCSGNRPSLESATVTETSLEDSKQFDTPPSCSVPSTSVIKAGSREAGAHGPRTLAAAPSHRFPGARKDQEDAIAAFLEKNHHSTFLRLQRCQDSELDDVDESSDDISGTHQPNKKRQFGGIFSVCSRAA